MEHCQVSSQQSEAPTLHQVTFTQGKARHGSYCMHVGLGEGRALYGNVTKSAHAEVLGGQLSVYVS